MQKTIGRFKKGFIIKYAKNFYRINSVERMKATWPNTSESFTTVSSNNYKIDSLEPTLNKLVHVDKIGINSYLEVQLRYPENSPRGAVRGTQRLNFRIAPHQNPYQWTFFVPETLPPYLEVYNPKSYTITGTDFIYFFGWIYEITKLGKDLPRDPATGEPKIFTELTNYIPLS